MFAKGSLQTVLALVSFCWLGSASAVMVHDFGILSPGVLYTHNQTVDGTGVDFDHDILFQIDGANDLGGSLSDIEISFQGTPLWDIDTLSVDLWASGAANPIAQYIGNNISIQETLGDGAYTLNVTGTTTGQSGGAYHVGLAVVPLPPAVFLFAPAMLGLAAVAHRKYQKAR